MSRARSTGHTGRWWVLGIVLLALLAGACSKSGAAEEGSNEPVKLVKVAGTDLHRVELTKTAVSRIGLETEPVTAAPGAGKPETVVPYAALIYDPGGATWVYTTVGPRRFLRHAVTVDRIDDEDVILTAGPPVGTNVVTVGAAEVYGSEFLSEHE
jgi:hypothetical protein